MQSYIMRRYTLVAPHTTNDGARSDYAPAVAVALLEAGIDGWTEYETVGWWRGKPEAGTTFEFFRADSGPVLQFVKTLGHIGRDCMPDQEAIQVTRDESTTTIYEA